MGGVTATSAVLALSAPQAIFLFLVGIAAGVFNGVAGGGTLLAFPALLAVGVPALTANITCSVGVVPSYLGSIRGFRTELVGQAARVRSLLPALLLGGATGATLLLSTPASSFRSVVPWLVLGATALFALQPLVVDSLSHLHENHPSRRILLQGGTVAISIYGGYFGAAAGVMMLAVFGIALTESLHRLTGLRVVCSEIINVLVAAIFILHGHVAWMPAAMLALGCLLGGWAGATVARRLPPAALRVVVVVVGATTGLVLLLR
jgi:uncharacterized membrane protein YfcA